MFPYGEKGGEKLIILVYEGVSLLVKEGIYDGEIRLERGETCMLKVWKA